MTVATLMSCSKDDKIVEPEPEKCQVLSITDNNSNTITMTYDLTGKLTKGVIVEPQEGSWTAESNFTYTTNSITVKGYSNIEYTLDSKGRIAGSKGIQDDAGYHNLVFTYNADGYLSKVTGGGDGYIATEEYSYAGGNLTTLKYSSTANNVPDYAFTHTLSYDAGKPYNSFSTATTDVSDLMSFSEGTSLGYLYEMGYLGKKSKNRITSIKNDKGETKTFSYDEDSKGNVTKVTAKGNDDEALVYSMNYSCK